MKLDRELPAFGLPRRFTRRRYIKVYAPNGARECARRRRQIAEGRLKPENGLCRTERA